MGSGLVPEGRFWEFLVQVLAWFWKVSGAGSGLVLRGSANA